VQDIAREILTLSAHGLKRRARLNSTGEDERIFLNPLRSIVERGQTIAEEMLEKYYKPVDQGGWGENIDYIFRDYAF